MLPMPFGNPSTYPGHSGADFAQDRGTPIRASGAGVVGLNNKTDRGGYQTWIDYDAIPAGNGIAYAHMDSPAGRLPVGTHVREGDVIGFVGSLGANSTGPHLHIEAAWGGGFDGVMKYFDRSRVVGGGSSAGAPLGAAQRRTIAVANRRAEPSSQAALAGDPLLAGTIGDFNGWVRGEAVEGNDVWFRGAHSGHWFWSGAFEGGATTAGLSDLNPAAPTNAKQRRAIAAANGRADASTSAAIRQTLPAGTVGDFDAWKHGESVEGEDRWIRGAHSGDWFWLGAFEPRNVDNLSGLTPSTPPPTSPPPASGERTVGAHGANGRGGPGRAYPVAQSLDPGTVGTFNGYAKGEAVEGIDIWFRGAISGNWFWAGGFTTQSTEGLPQVTEWPAPPANPTSPDNPRGLPTYPPIYPGAYIGLTAPLGDGRRGTGYADQRPVPVVIDQFHLHRTGTDGDDGDWFSHRNSRSSCPHLHILQDGRTREFIRPQFKPALTGPDWNWRGYGVEIQGAGNGTPEQFERVADAMAWLASHEGKYLDGVLVTYNLRQRANTTLNHREMIPGTDCPGDWWASRMDALIDRARVILAEKYAPQPGPDTVPVERSWLQSVLDKLKSLLGVQ